jgi:hypothetical protein
MNDKRLEISNAINDLAGLGVNARQQLVHSILANPHETQLAKLSLRLLEPAQEAALAMESAAKGHRNASLWRPVLLTGVAAAASFMLFNAPNIGQSPQIQTPLVAQQSDRFGPSASFEGEASMSDRFGSGGFEAN